MATEQRIADDQGEPWYAVMTRPGMEAKAAADLKRQGFWTFYPFERVRVRRKIPNRNAHLVTTVERPYFSRYIFLMVRQGQSLYRVNNTPSVSTVVYMGGAPLRVPDSAMEAIMSRADEAGLVGELDEVARHKFPAGQMLRFCDESPLRGLIVTVADDMGKSIRVVAEMFGVEREIIADPKHVEILKETA
jgi:transcription antitermination factor NusG